MRDGMDGEATLHQSRCQAMQVLFYGKGGHRAATMPLVFHGQCNGVDSGYRRAASSLQLGNERQARDSLHRKSGSEGMGDSRGIDIPGAASATSSEGTLCSHSDVDDGPNEHLKALWW